LANLSHQVANPPTDKSDQQKQNNFVHHYLDATWVN
jgi:hypothetical protein